MKWRFKLADDFEWQCGQRPDGVDDCITFSDQAKGKVRLRVFADGRICVKKGYAWDGCSPKLSVFDLFWLGTPDGIADAITRKPATYEASLIHDALYQFMDDERMPFTRGHMDRFFLELMRRRRFLLRHPYYWAVRLAGGGYHWLMQALH